MQQLEKTLAPHWVVPLLPLAWSPNPVGGPLAAFDSEHDENLGLTSDTEKKFKIINHRRFAITRDIQGKIH